MVAGVWGIHYVRPVGCDGRRGRRRDLHLPCRQRRLIFCKCEASDPTCIWAAGTIPLMTTVAIPFVRIDPRQNPNLKIREGYDPAEPYFRTMVVAFASLRRWHPEAALQFISNAEPPKMYAEHFSRLGVDFKPVAFEHEPPAGFARHFTASLYLLDALASLTADRTVVVDPDILCVGSIDRMLDDSGQAVGVLRMGFPTDENINGITRQQAGELHADLGEPADSPDHYGGEAYVIPKEHLDTILERCEKAWDFTLERHAAGGTKFMTEEHILSYAVRGVPIHHLNEHVRRIWTTHRYRRVNGKESQLSLWHLPAEKDRGFDALFDDAINPNSWFWTAPRDEFVDRCGRAMGLHHRPAERVLKDTVGYVVRAAEDTVKKMRKSVLR